MKKFTTANQKFGLYKGQKLRNRSFSITDHIGEVKGGIQLRSSALLSLQVNNKRDTICEAGSSQVNICHISTKFARMR